MSKGIYVGVETNKPPINQDIFSEYFSVSRFGGSVVTDLLWFDNIIQQGQVGNIGDTGGYNFKAIKPMTLSLVCSIYLTVNASKTLYIRKTDTAFTSLSAMGGEENYTNLLPEGSISITRTPKTINLTVELNEGEYIFFGIRGSNASTAIFDLQFSEIIDGTIEVAKPVKNIYVGVPLATKEGNIILTPEMIEQYFTLFTGEINSEGWCSVDVTVPQQPDDIEYGLGYTLGPAKDNLKIIIFGRGASDEGGGLRIMNSSNTLLETRLPANTANTNNYQDFNIEVNVSQGDYIDFDVIAYSDSANAMAWADFQIAFVENPPNIEAKQVAKKVKAVYVGDENGKARLSWSKEEE